MSEYAIFVHSYDFYLLPFYLLGIFICAAVIARKYQYSKLVKFFFFAGLFVKLLGSICFALMQVYISKEGDTFMYFSAAMDILGELRNNFSSGIRLFFLNEADFGYFYENNFNTPLGYGYMSAARNIFVAKTTALLAIPGLKGYILTSLFFGIISFSGMWRMFMLFSKLYPSMVKSVSVCFLFMPSLFFWGSGILKDPLCLGALGWAFTSFYYFFISKKYQLKYFLTAVVGLYVLFIIKDYIAASILLCFVIWMLLQFIIVNGKVNRKIVAGIIAVFFLGVLIFYEQIQTALTETLVETVTDYVKESQKLSEKFGSDKALLTNISLEKPTLGVLIKNIPNAMLNSLFRPFIWEVNSVGAILAALENCLLMGLFIYIIIVKGPVSIFKRTFSSQIIFISFLFVLIFSICIGFTCFNFGTIVRYRLPCLPFFLLYLTFLYYNKVEAQKI